MVQEEGSHILLQGLGLVLCSHEKRSSVVPGKRFSLDQMKDDSFLLSDKQSRLLFRWDELLSCSEDCSSLTAGRTFVCICRGKHDILVQSVCSSHGGKSVYFISGEKERFFS